MRAQAAPEREQREEDVCNAGGRKAWKKSSGTAGHRRMLRRKRVPPQEGTLQLSAVKQQQKYQPTTPCNGCQITPRQQWQQDTPGAQTVVLAIDAHGTALPRGSGERRSQNMELSWTIGRVWSMAWSGSASSETQL